MTRAVSGKRPGPALLAVVCAGLLTAALPVTRAAAEDAVRGAVLAGPCASCHGPGGHSPGTIPSLSSLSAADIARYLSEFRSGAREGTVMNRIARGYDEGEIAALAAYFATRAEQRATEGDAP